MRRQRQQGQGYDRSWGKTKVTEGGLRAISLHLSCDWGPGPLAGGQAMGE